ncbi:hypothetical protein SBA4_3530002 [Candidatus Sulfopaludibacter sp. SbA4]|nr:hypothetical protein SBA4_3530002 [Candidatus Sulfopaludibacter sp. SbA4]
MCRIWETRGAGLFGSTRLPAEAMQVASPKRVGLLKINGLTPTRRCRSASPPLKGGTK